MHRAEGVPRSNPAPKIAISHELSSIGGLPSSGDCQVVRKKLIFAATMPRNLIRLLIII